MAAPRVGLTGSTGRMGLAVRDALSSATDLQAGPALQRGDRLDTLAGRCEVVIDFTTPAVLSELAAFCAGAGLPLVSGTTGADDDTRAQVIAAARHIPVVWAPNMSVGVNILLYLTEKTSEILDNTWQVRVSETHHVHKRDAPSGTALRLGEAIEALRGPGSVDYDVQREGEVIGFHRVGFDGPGERLALEHEALDRRIFAEGALRAAAWAVGKPPGLYGMAEVLGLK